MRIVNLAGVFTGRGFSIKQGRYTKDDDCGFLKGPIGITCSRETGIIQGIGHLSVGDSLDEEILDGTGLFATSGFIDSHTHAIHGGQRCSEYFMRWSGASYLDVAKYGGGIRKTISDTEMLSDEELRSCLSNYLRDMLCCGTTTVEVKSGYASTPDGELRLLRIIRGIRNLRNIPDVYATFLGLHAISDKIDERCYCDSMIEALPIISKENLAIYIDAFAEKGNFSLEESIRFIRAGQSYGLKAKVHCDEFTDMVASEAFIKSNAISIDHLQKINRCAIDLLKDYPTVATLLPTTSFFLGIEYANARLLIDSGVKLALATDFNPGTSPSLGFQLTNILAASQMKMTAPEIFCGCTYNGAAAMGLADRYGTLEPGKVANIVLWQTLDKLPKGHGTSILEEIIVSNIKPSMVILHGDIIKTDSTL
ncbi:MAG: imidazolonepropionase [Nitrospirae bacterium]|nr:imidazolonepropionase [Nitrospirota bacterium]